eukprot:6590071-Prymnesium_polylepis.1
MPAGGRAAAAAADRRGAGAHRVQRGPGGLLWARRALLPRNVADPGADEPSRVAASDAPVCVQLAAARRSG